MILDLPTDVLPSTMAHSRIQETDIRELYTTNTDNYSTYMNKLNPYLHHLIMITILQLTYCEKCVGKF